MKRNKYAGTGTCRCSYCTAQFRGRNKKRANKLRWILKFDEKYYFIESKIKDFQKIEA